jgi:hypothetical protein
LSDASIAGGSDGDALAVGVAGQSRHRQESAVEISMKEKGK